ncbi:MAG: IS3 family transposase [Actinomycetota bacterium]
MTNSNPPPKRYPQEMRDRAVRLVGEAIEEQGGNRYGVIPRIAKQLGVGAESLRTWVLQEEKDNGRRPGLTTHDQLRIKELEKENRELRRANEILKAASKFLRAGARPATAEMTGFIDEYKDLWGVESICAQLPIAPSTYYAAKSRQPSARSVSDAEMKDKIQEVFDDNYKVYGARKIWKELLRKQVAVGRDQVARLMAELGIRGASRGKVARTTIPAPDNRPEDLVNRQFQAPAPNRLWLADLTYVWTVAGFCYVAFISDAFSRAIVGWRVSRSLSADLALDALEMAIHSRGGQGLGDLVHHSDRGVQYLAIRYTERLEQEGAVTSVGSKGDSYDNAAAETINGLYKTELINRQGPWRNCDEVELATLGWVDWWNTRRLHGACGDIPPLEFEGNYYRELEEASKQVSTPTV